MGGEVGGDATWAGAAAGTRHPFWNAALAAFSFSGITAAYRAVVFESVCPNSSWTSARSIPPRLSKVA